MRSFASIAESIDPAERIVHRDINLRDVKMRMYVDLLKEPDVKIPTRELTAYNKFVQKKMPFIRKMHKKDHFKIIGALWSSMSTDEKRMFA